MFIHKSSIFIISRLHKQICAYFRRLTDGNHCPHHMSSIVSVSQLIRKIANYLFYVPASYTGYYIIYTGY